MTSLRYILAFGLVILFFDEAFAETTKGPTKEELLGVLDVAVPTSPAFSLLGLSPDAIANPQTGPDVAAALLSGLDARGNAQSGIAIDFKPYMAFFGDKLFLSEYKNNPIKRELAKVNLSIATASGSSTEDKADRYSVGIRWTPIDDADPRRDEALAKCFREFLSFSDEPQTVDEEMESNNDAELANDIKKCRAAFKSRTWNAKALQIGLAQFHVHSESLKETGSGAWISYAFPLSKRSQVIFHARALKDELVPPELATDPFLIRDSKSYGLRGRYGTGSAFLMIEALQTRNNWRSAREDDDYTQYSLGGEFKIAQNVWIQLSYGDSNGSGAPNTSAVFSSQLRFGFSKERLVDLGL